MESNVRERLQGIFVPIATPFKENEDLDTDALTHNLALYGDTALRGCLVLGSNGECKSLDEAEKATVLETVFADASERLTITVGVMYEASRYAERFIRRIADLGADFALVQSPSYFRKQMTDDALYAYFSGLADRAPIPLLIYHCPGFNGITLSFDLLEKLSEHPNIAGMKDSTPGCDLSIMQLNRDSFHVMAGSVAKLSDFVQHGSVGGTISVANYAPALAVELYQCLSKHGSAGCADLNRKVIAMNQSVSGHLGVPGVKVAMNLLGFQGGISRRPLLPLQADQIKGIESALAEAGVLHK
jgi:4-hydroxy-2-oxoglutarate aldolase